MLKTVNRQIFYHIQHGNQKISKSGDILDIGSTENYFMVFYRTFNLNTVPLQTAYAELRRYFREQIFENVREKYFPNYPSRLKCLWLIPDSPKLNEALTFWIPQVVGNINNPFRILKLSCTGNVCYTCEEFLSLEKCNTLEATHENAVHYWNGDNVAIDSPHVEVLFCGTASVQEVIDPFDPKHQL